MKKLTTEEFIQKAKLVHGDKYDYSKVEYEHSAKKICIICSKHEEFWQAPYHHLYGSKCPKCSNFYKPTTEEFIQKAKLVHGDKYDYSKVEYVGIKINIYINCIIHGIFNQTPETHLMGCGCPICANKIRNIKKRGTTEEFIQKAKLIHSDEYDYSKVEYKNNSIKVCIICFKHGEFLQSPRDHIYQNQGCPKCQRSKGEKAIETYLKENHIQYETQKKFKDCKNKNYLPFDFYLPYYNVCIEYDGEQHFRPIKHWTNNMEFQRTQMNDNIKNIYCQNNNINLLRIPYWEFKNINQILKEEVGFEPTNP